MKTINRFLPIILAALFCSALSVTVTYFLKVLPLQEAIQEIQLINEDKVVKDCAHDISLAVSLREAKQDQILHFLDEKNLPFAIEILEQYSEQDTVDSHYSKYLLWKIKKYSKDFSVTFPAKEMEIINKVPEEYSTFKEQK